MRVSAETRQRTREAILGAARALLTERGWADTTTRDVAAAAGIAAGTLFNYFPNKDAVATTLLAEALDAGTADWRAHRRAGAGLAEELFGLVAALLRALAPHRTWVGPVLGSALSPFARSPGGDAVRAAHLEELGRLLAEHATDPAHHGGPSPVSAHLYWTLFLGVLAFWSEDDSPHQEDSLAVLDQSLALFVSSLP